MTEFLKDYSDYVVLIPSLVIGGFISYWFFTKQRQLKSIYYEVINNYNIVEIDKSYKDVIEVFFNKQRVSNLWLVVVRFVNNGNTPIEKKDFDNHVSLTISKNSNLLHFEIFDPKPTNLPITATLNDNSINIEPCLLNPSDSYSIRFMTSGSKPEINVSARIAGISEISLKNTEKEKSNNFVFRTEIIITTLLGLISVLVSFASISEIMDIFIKPKVEFLNSKAIINKENLGDLKLVVIPTTSTARDKEIFYYKINQDDELLKSINDNGKWEINLTNKVNKLTEGKNEICYKFDVDDNNYQCIEFETTFNSQINNAPNSDK